jgi:phage terminase large subunit-like protein
MDYPQLNSNGLESRVAALINRTKGHGGASNSDLHELLEMIQELDRREEFSGIAKWFPVTGPYSIYNLPKHKAYIDATRDYREILLLGGNRSGKTSVGAYICAVLATGLYPEWWEGVRFEGPVEIWACGKTGQSTRDTVQEALMGKIGAEGTGMLPLSCIGRKTRALGTNDLLDTVEVYHTSGKKSIIGFKTYKQEAPSFYGSKKHLVWLDEPCPEDIYNECLIRTSVLPGGYEGRLIHTITPKEGLTRLLADFLASCDLLAGTERIDGIDSARAMMALEEGMDHKEAVKIMYGEEAKGAPTKRHRACVAIGWDDIPWMSDQAKKEILESTPPHLRETVSQGIPSVGDGAVYPLPLHDLLLKPSEVFPIPAHYEKMYGMDVGWDRTAAVFGARDPDSGVLYIYGEHYVPHQPPEVHAARIKAVAGDWMVGCIDPASKQPLKDGTQLIQEYRRLGLRLREADNAVEAGIMKTTSLMTQGKLKLFPHTTPNLQAEYLTYRREGHKIVKDHDHALDALRYMVMGLRFAKVQPLGHGVAGIKGPLIQVSRRYF